MWKCAVCHREAQGPVCRTCGTLRWEDPFALRTLAPLTPGDIRALRDRQEAWEKTRQEQERQMASLLEEKLRELEQRMEQRMEERIAQLRLELMPPAPEPDPLPDPEEKQIPEDLEEAFRMAEEFSAYAPVTAIPFYQAAAEGGLPAAQMALGRCYERGLGVEPDPKKAVDWYQQAAWQGNLDAMSAMGRCYKNGIGTDVDILAAAEWLTQAMGEDAPGARWEYNALFTEENAEFLNKHGYFMA